MFSAATMRLLLFCFLWVVCCYADDNDLDMKIIGGTLATDGAYPHQVSVQFDLGPGGWQKFCGGSILDEKWVLTAAHCVKYAEDNFFPLYVRAGVTNALEKNANTQLVNVKKMFKHPNYTGGTAPAHDVGLFLMRTPFKFTKYVQPIALPPVDYIPTGEGDLIGWGAVGNPPADVKTNELMTVHVKITPLSLCKMNLRGITDNHVCPGERGKTSCAGDSGGPFIQDIDGIRRIVGISSFGRRPCGQVAEAYTRVSAYIDDYILPIMRDNK